MVLIISAILSSSFARAWISSRIMGVMKRDSGMFEYGVRDIVALVFYVLDLFH